MVTRTKCTNLFAFYNSGIKKILKPVVIEGNSAYNKGTKITAITDWVMAVVYHKGSIYAGVYVI